MKKTQLVKVKEVTTTYQVVNSINMVLNSTRHTNNRGLNILSYDEAKYLFFRELGGIGHVTKLIPLIKEELHRYQKYGESSDLSMGNHKVMIFEDNTGLNMFIIGNGTQNYIQIVDPFSSNKISIKFSSSRGFNPVFVDYPNGLINFVSSLFSV